MKNVLLILALLAIAILSYFLFLNPACPNCKYDVPTENSFPKDLDLSLKFDCSSEEFQPLHLDLINSFGVFGKPKMQENNTSMEIELILIEVGTCKRYAINSAIINDQTSRSEELVVDFTIGEFSENIQLKKSLTIPVEVGRVIDMHIISPKFPELEAPKKDSINVKNDFIYYPPRFCRAKIVNSIGSRFSTKTDSLNTFIQEVIN